MDSGGPVVITVTDDDGEEQTLEFVSADEARAALAFSGLSTGARAALNDVLCKGAAPAPPPPGKPQPTCKPRVLVNALHGLALSVVVVTATPAQGKDVAAWLGDVLVHTPAFRDVHRQRGWWRFLWSATPDKCVTTVLAWFVDEEKEQLWLRFGARLAEDLETPTLAEDVLLVSVDSVIHPDVDAVVVKMTESQEPDVEALWRTYGRLQRPVGPVNCPVVAKDCSRSSAFLVRLQMSQPESSGDILPAMWVRAALERVTHARGTWRVKFERFARSYNCGVAVLARFFGELRDFDVADDALFCDDYGAFCDKEFGCDGMARALRALPLPQCLADVLVVGVSAVSVANPRWDTFGGPAASWLK